MQTILSTIRMIPLGNKSISEISLELGFCSQSHFNRIFKKITGETPKKYNYLFSVYK